MKVNLNTEFGAINVPAKELVVDGCHTNIIKLGNSIIRLPSTISCCDISSILLYGGIPVTGIMEYYVGDNFVSKRERIHDYVLIRRTHPTKREFELQII